MRSKWPVWVFVLLWGAGCTTQDIRPPAVPRGLRTVTGNGWIYLTWEPNTEPDLAGYRVYRSRQPYGAYTEIGKTADTEFWDEDVENGVTYYYALTAYDFAGNESDLTPELVYDTPRPDGWNALLQDKAHNPDRAGWDFSAARTVAWDDSVADLYYENETFVGVGNTDLLDFGPVESLYEVDEAPLEGWDPDRRVPVVPGHAYVIWTRDNHFAAIHVREMGQGFIRFDWAYQTAEGNPELAFPFAVRENRR